MPEEQHTQIVHVTVPKELLTEQEAASYLCLDPNTLRVWRSKSRRAKRLIGPPWTTIGDGERSPIRYRLIDLQTYASQRVTKLRREHRPVGRKRKPIPTLKEVKEMCVA